MAFIDANDSLTELMHMPSKDGWSFEKDHDKVTLGKKQYRNMEEWSRPCGVCAEKFAIYVRGSAASASVNASFGLRTCKEHRGQKVGAAGVPFDNGQLEELRAELKNLQGLLDVWGTNWKLCYPLLKPYGLTTAEDFTAAVNNMFNEIQVLKAKLAQFDLSTAFAAIGCEPKMPWS